MAQVTYTITVQSDDQAEQDLWKDYLNSIGATQEQPSEGFDPRTDDDQALTITFSYRRANITVPIG